MLNVGPMKREVNTLYQVVDLLECRIDQVAENDFPLVALQMIVNLSEALMQNITALHEQASHHLETLVQAEKEKTAHGTV